MTTTPMTDAQLARYIYLQTAIKQLETEKEELRALILIQPTELHSDAYSVRITTSISERVEGLKVIKDRSPKLFDALMVAGCIREVTTQRVIVEPKVQIPPA